MADWGWLLVGLGSAIGGIARYSCGGAVDAYYGQNFPVGTLSVNVVGSVLIGLLASLMLADGRLLLGPDARQFLIIGVLGGFTTFSSFSLQSLTLMQEGDWLAAGLYVMGSVLLCLFGVWAGHMLGTTLGTTLGR